MTENIEQPHSAEWFGSDRNFWWNHDFLKLMAKRWELDKVHSVLDVGCGIGHWGLELSTILPKEAKIYGVDLEQEWVDKARELTKSYNGRFEYKVALADKIPYPDNTFDMVTCQTLLMHVPDAKTALLEMRRVLKPNGILAVCEPNSFVNCVLYDSLFEGETLEDFQNIVKFNWLCEKGGRLSGNGFQSVGDLLPGYFADINLHDIQVYLSDKAMSLIPPYSTKEQQAVIESLERYTEDEHFYWGREKTKQWYEQGGGTDFDKMWEFVRAHNNKRMEAIKNKTYAHGGAFIFYLVSGRKA